MEHILTPKVENVKLVDRLNPKTSTLGTLYLTTTHLIFVSNDVDSANAEANKKELWMLHMLMHTIDKPLLTTSGTLLKILCHHFLSASFIIQRDKDANDVYLSLLALSNPKEYSELYCFSYNPKGEIRQTTGWNFFDLQAEYQRQGVPNPNWSHYKNDYLCPTYPKHLFVPALASSEVIEGSAKFRSKSRLPVLSLLHKNNAAIIRCAQPLVGISGVRSAFDEKYVQCLRLATSGAPYIQIIDTRPAMNALANRAGGKGYESEKFYDNIRFDFKGIENIHKMRSSLKQLMSNLSSSSSMDSFLSELASSGWLKHIKAILDSSLAIMSSITNGISVIVHCSDGWDRTAQTCALAGIMLDGYYRTIQGFQALIEKEWLSFGHKFSDRCGHLNGDPNEVSPIFTQFLDATWQLTQQYPQMFQFNESYLICIHEHAYSCQYGTFIGNSESQREQLKLRENTYSLWGYLVANHDDFANPLYDRSTASEILRPDTSPQNIRFWSGLYCRFEHGAHPREPLIDLLTITKNHTSSLEDHGRQLSKTLTNVGNLIASAKAAGAVRKILPSSSILTGGSSSGSSTVRASGAALANSSEETSLDSDFGRVEKKFADLKTSIVEKCQSRFISMMMVDTVPVIQHTVNHEPNVKPIITNHLYHHHHHEVDSARVKDLEKINQAEINKILHSVAVEWSPLRHVTECACGFVFNGGMTSAPRTHCRRCGGLFCKRCILFDEILPGHDSETPVPVCNRCKNQKSHFD